MITLCLDFGNSRLKAAVFDDENFKEEIVLEADGLTSLEKILDQYKPAKSILSSVVNHNPRIEELLIERTVFHKLNPSTKLNFSINVTKPETVGADRLALIAAAVHSYPGKNNLIISLGTCITYSFVNQYQQFLGGSISPGMDMRFKAMHEYTAKLPLVNAAWNFPLIGYDTPTNLQSGVALGIRNELDGFINNYLEKYDNFNAVLTGGNSPYFAGEIKNKIFADFHFLYKGLYALSELNNCGNE